MYERNAAYSQHYIRLSTLALSGDLRYCQTLELSQDLRPTVDEEFSLPQLRAGTLARIDTAAASTNTPAPQTAMPEEVSMHVRGIIFIWSRGCPFTSFPTSI